MTRTGAFALIVVLGLCGASAATFGGVLGVGLPGGRVAEAEQTLEPNVDRIELAVSAADVEITGSDVDRIQVHERIRHWFGAPDQTFHVDGDTLTLDDEGCGWGCDVEYAIQVPTGTTVSGTAASGSVELENVAGADVRVQSGTIAVERISGDLVLRTSSGDIEGEQLAGRSVDVRASSGDIELELTDPRTVHAEASSGDVQLTVPDFPYQLTTSASSGDVETGDIRQDAGAERRLDVRTSSGDIELELGSDAD
jgi:DUF4097 and DUF4098 domain-containing protein YvlB